MCLKLPSSYHTCFQAEQDPDPLAKTTSTTRIDLGTDELIFETDSGIAWLTFNRPEARNAMTWAMYDGLVRACERVDADNEIRLFILRGAGDSAFVSGTDISQFKAFKTTQDALKYEKNQNRNIGRVEMVQKPTIAMIHGFCTGGGANIAMACDLRIASTTVKFGVPIARTLGNTLSSETLARILGLIGPARAKELLFTARLVDAAEGKALGLFNEVVEPEQLESRTRALATQILSHAPLTIRSIKEGIRRILQRGRIEEQEDLVSMCYMSEDFKEGVQAFLEKRPPQWKGK